MMTNKRLKRKVFDAINKLREGNYLLAVVLLALCLSGFFYFFWTGGWILKQSGDVEMFNYVRYFDYRTKSVQSFIPSTLYDFFPMFNPVVTVHLLLPLFPLLSNYKFLVLTQVSAAGLSIITFYLLAKEYLSRFKSLLLTITYAIAPFTVFNLFLEGFKPDYIAFPFIFLLFYAYKKRSYKTFLFSCFFLALTKQTLMPILFLFGIYVIFRESEVDYKTIKHKFSSLKYLKFDRILSKMGVRFEALKDRFSAFLIGFIIIEVIIIFLVGLDGLDYIFGLILSPLPLFLLLISLGVFACLNLGSRKYVLAPLLIGGVSFAIYLFIVWEAGGVIAQTIETNYAYGVDQLLSDPGLILERVGENYQEIIRVLSYNLFLPVMSPGILFVSLPKFFDAIMVSNFYRFKDEITMLTPFLYIATLLSFSKLKNWLKNFVSGINVDRIIVSLLFALVAVNTLSLATEVKPRVEKNQGYPTLNCGCCNFEQGSLKQRRASLESILKYIPQNSRVVAPKHVMLFVYEEKNKQVDLLPGKYSGDYLLLDKCLINYTENDFCVDYYKKDIEFEDYRDYNKLKEIGDFVLLGKN